MNNSKQNQINNEEQKPKPSKNGKNWIGNILKNRDSRTSEEYWCEVRKTLLPEYLELFDVTPSIIIKDILKTSSKLKPEYRFQISIYYFESLSEKDFQDLKKFTDILRITACDPGRLLLAILKKKELEKYSLDFRLSQQSILDIFTERWNNEYYTLSF